MMDPRLRNDTRPLPTRRRTEWQQPIRQELPRRSPPSQAPVQEERFDEAPAEVRGVDPEVRFGEVQDTEDVHHQVDVWQDARAVDDLDDAPASECDDRDQEQLLDDVDKVQEPNEDTHWDDPLHPGGSGGGIAKSTQLRHFRRSRFSQLPQPKLFIWLIAPATLTT